MKQHHLTRQNEYVIKDIARQLPDIPLLSLKLGRKIYKSWVYRTKDWLFTRKWPNGEALIPAKVVIWVNQKCFGLNNDHFRNHERRLRRAYLRNGIIGVSHYLSKLGAREKLIAHWLQDFEQTDEDLRAAKKLEKKIKIKLTGS